jgi:hypothetical protein
MEKRHVAAALILPLVLTAPLKAQGAAGVSGDDRAMAGPSNLPPRESRTSYLPLREGGAGINLSTTPMVQQDGSAVYRKALVGSVPLSNDVSVGLGLIEVTRTRIKERSLARTRPLEDTGGRSDRIAAVGLSIRF